MMEGNAAVGQEEAGAGPGSPPGAWRWQIFAVGNLIQIASVVYEVIVLDVCMTQADPDARYSPTDQEVEEQAKGITTVIRMALILGLGYDLLSTLILSKVYGSPMDAKHSYKIPPEDQVGCCTIVLIRHATPFVWGTVCVLMGAASMALGTDGQAVGDMITCDLTRNKTNLKIAVYFSGLALVLLGGFLLVVMAVLLPCVGYCCKPATTCFSRISTIFPLVDLTWQGFGILWGYSAGSFGVVAVSVLAGLEILAFFFTFVGSFVLLSAKVGLDNISIG